MKIIQFSSKDFKNNINFVKRMQKNRKFRQIVTGKSKFLLRIAEKQISSKNRSKKQISSKKREEKTTNYPKNRTKK